MILVSELLFGLLFTNSIVERAFSAMKIVKTNRRTSLLSSTLDDLMEINIEGPELENFSRDHAPSPPPSLDQSNSVISESGMEFNVAL